VIHAARGGRAPVLRLARRRLRGRRDVEIVHGDAREVEPRGRFDAIVTSPPYPGLIDHHDQHRYAYELLGLDDRRDRELGAAARGTSRNAIEAHVAGVAAVLERAACVLRRGATLLIVVNDRRTLYPDLLERAGLRLDARYRRHVNRRTGRRSGEYFEDVLVARRYRLPSGFEREFEIKLEAATAVVLALTPEQCVVLVREFRPGVEADLLELPGGVVDVGEEPLEAARRELLEETGYSGDVELVGSMVDCAYSTRLRNVFAARVARQVAEPTPEEGEAPEVVLVSLDEFRAHLRTGRLTDVGPGYVALDRLGLL